MDIEDESSTKLAAQWIFDFRDIGCRCLRRTWASEIQSFVSTGRHDDVERFLDVDLPSIRRFLGQPTTSVLVPINRFEAETGEARARSYDVTCIDRNLYEVMDAANPTATDAAADLLPHGDPFSADDCPDLANDARVVVTNP